LPFQPPPDGTHSSKRISESALGREVTSTRQKSDFAAGGSSRPEVRIAEPAVMISALRAAAWFGV